MQSFLDLNLYNASQAGPFPALVSDRVFAGCCCAAIILRARSAVLRRRTLSANPV